MTLTPFSSFFSFSLLWTGASWGTDGRATGRGTFTFSCGYYGDFAKDLRGLFTFALRALYLKPFLFFRQSGKNIEFNTTI